MMGMQIHEDEAVLAGWLPERENFVMTRHRSCREYNGPRHESIYTRELSVQVTGGTGAATGKNDNICVLVVR